MLIFAERAEAAAAARGLAAASGRWRRRADGGGGVAWSACGVALTAVRVAWWRTMIRKMPKAYSQRSSPRLCWHSTHSREKGMYMLSIVNTV